MCRNFCFGVAVVDDSISGAVPSGNPNVYLDEFHQSTRSSTETSLCKSYSDCSETSDDAFETVSTRAGFAIFVERFGALISITPHFTFPFHRDALKPCYVQE